MKGQEELLTVREVARRCHRSEETIRRWIWSGKLPARKIGNQLFVERTDLERMQAPRLAEPRAEYRAGRQTGPGEEALPRAPVPYDREEALRQAEDDFQFGQMLREKYGPVDVVELFRQLREEGDEP